MAIYPGPARSEEEYETIRDAGPVQVPLAEFLRWSNTAAFPQIPTKAAFGVWRKIKAHPRFDGEDLSLSLSHTHTGQTNIPRWRFRPVQGDLNASTDRHRFRRDDGRSVRSRNSTRPTTGTGT